ALDEVIGLEAGDRGDQSVVFVVLELVRVEPAVDPQGPAQHGTFHRSAAEGGLAVALALDVGRVRDAVRVDRHAGAIAAAVVDAAAVEGAELPLVGTEIAGALDALGRDRAAVGVMALG